MARRGVQVKHYKTTNSLGINIEEPQECPICHHATHPEVLCAHAPMRDRDWDHDGVIVVFVCPREDCQDTYVGRFERNAINGVYELTVFHPRVAKVDVPEEIEKVSPDFVKIQKEALTAEASGLNEMAGMGLRKALEFLIKDYLVSKAQDEDEKAAIRKEFLGTCIKSRVSEPSLEQVAERAVWLGNDETHYEKRWSKDIEDLKRLVRLTVLWIEREILTEKTIAEMPSS